eukprot:1177493-Prorocentrum_minimum.AAC.1
MYKASDPFKGGWAKHSAKASEGWIVEESWLIGRPIDWPGRDRTAYPQPGTQLGLSHLRTPKQFVVQGFFRNPTGVCIAFGVLGGRCGNSSRRVAEGGQELLPRSGAPSARFPPARRGLWSRDAIAMSCRVKTVDVCIF